MRLIIQGAGTGFESLAANTISQLGWHPPLEFTKQDMIAEEVFEKKGEKLPIGFFIHALKMGRKLHMITLEKTHDDLSEVLSDLQNRLSGLDSDSEGARQVLQGIKYNEILRHDLDVVASAVDNGGYASDRFLIQAPSTDGSLQVRDAIPYEQVSDLSLAVVTPHAHDVLFGRGNAASNHVGNVNWRILIATNKSLYGTLAKNQKTLLFRSIVMAIRNQSPPGRFLQKDPETNLWFDVGIQRATEKTSQAMHDIQAPIIAPAHHYKPRRPRPMMVKPDGGFYSTRRYTRAV